MLKRTDTHYDTTGRQVYLNYRPGFFAQPWYPVLVFVLLASSAQLLSLILLIAGTYANGVRYPRQHGVFKRGYFLFSFIAGVVIPFAAIFWGSATTVSFG